MDQHDHGGEECAQDGGLRVSRKDGGLLIRVSVESGFVSRDFDLPCSEHDLRALADQSRRRVLEVPLQEYLQPLMVKDARSQDASLLPSVLQTVLHGTPADVEAEIARHPKAAYVRLRLSQVQASP